MLSVSFHHNNEKWWCLSDAYKTWKTWPHNKRKKKKQIKKERVITKTVTTATETKASIPTTARKKKKSQHLKLITEIYYVKWGPQYNDKWEETSILIVTTFLLVYLENLLGLCDIEMCAQYPSTVAVALVFKYRKIS